MSTEFDVFLSYNSADRPLVAEIAERLRDGAGIAPWFDRWQLAVGDNWQHGLEEGLRQSGACAIFAGPNGLGEWQLDEIRSAQVLRKERKEFQIVPVLLPGSDSKSLPLFLRSNFNWIDLRDGIDDQAIRSLVAGVKGQEQAASTRTEVSDRCPYKGLDAYQEGDAEFFFGRDVFVEQILLEHLRHSRTIAVVGMSGSGKSSAVRAGLLPRLRQERFRGSAPQHIITLKPGERPLEELAVQLSQALYTQDQRVLQLPMLLRELHASEETLHLVLRSAASSGPFLILIDQFEEVFTLCNDEEQRHRFFDNIFYASSLSDSPVHIVITMRSDFVSKCASYPDMNMLISENFLQMPDMSVADIRSAIVEPARRAGLRFEHGLVEIVMHDVEESAASLPLLQHALLRLWERRDGGMLTIAAYHEIGGVQGSLVRHADEIFALLPLGQQDLCRKIFLRLVTLGEGTGDTRRRAHREELVALGPGVEPILHTLIDKRLLVGAKDSIGGKETVEIIHEALIRGWPRLNSWLDADRDFLRFRQRLIGDVHEWQKRGSSPDDVYRGAHLAEAEEFLQSQGEELTPNERAFVEHGIALRQAEADAAIARQREEVEREQRAKRRLRKAFIFASIGFVVSIILGLYVKHESTVSRSRQIAAEVLLAKTADPAELLRRALEAYNLSPTFEAGQALRFALRESSSRTVIEHSGATGIACSPVADVVAVASEDSSIHIWSISQKRLLRRLQGLGQPVGEILLSDNGRTVWTRNEGTGLFCAWDIASGRIQRYLNHSDTLTTFDYEHGRLALTYAKGYFEVIDLATGTRILQGGAGALSFTRLSEDGKYVSLMNARTTVRGDHNVLDVWDIDAGRQTTHAVLTTGDDAGVLFVSGTPYILVSLGWKGEKDFSLHEREDTIFKVFDITTGRAVSNWKLPRLTGWKFGCMIPALPTDRKLAIGHSRSISVVDFDPQDPHKNEISLNFDAPGELKGLFFDPSGSFLLHITPGDPSLSVWSLKDGHRMFLRGHPGGIIAGGFSYDAREIVTLGADHSVAIWETTSQWGIEREEEVGSIYGGSVYESQLIGDTSVWVSRSADKTTARLNMLTGLVRETGKSPLTSENLSRWSDGLHTIERLPRHNPDGSKTGTTLLRIWDFPDFKTHRDIIDSVDDPRASVEMDSLATTILSYPPYGKGVRLLSAKDGHLLRMLPFDITEGYHIYDGQRFFTARATARNMVCFDVETGKQFACIRASGGMHSNDYGGKAFLFYNGDTTIPYIIDAEKGLARKLTPFKTGILEGGNQWYVGSCCPDDKSMWQRNANGDIVLRDLESGKFRDAPIFKAHNEQFRYVTFTADMSIAVAICMHGNIDVFDGKTGELLSEIPYGKSEADLSISRDGKFIVAYGRNSKVVQVYRTSNADVVKLAEERLKERTTGDLSKF